MQPRVRKDKRKIKPAEDHALPPKSHLRPKYKEKKKEAQTKPDFDINFGFCILRTNNCRIVKTKVPAKPKGTI